MTEGEPKRGEAGRISLAELEALNHEIASLVRAGVPLDRGLLGAGADVRGRLGRIAKAIGEHLRRGESLPEALRAEERSIPPLYRAVVEAGARSGKLPVALEGLAHFVRGYSEARASVGVALWYPLLVMTLAYALFVGLVIEVIPRFVGAFESLGLHVIWPLRWLERLGEYATYWCPLWPILLLLLALAWWRSGVAATFQSTSWSFLRAFPWMRSMVSDYESAGFADLLALLVEHHVAYPTAVELAAQSTGNPAMIAGAHQLASAIGRGEPAEKAVRELPPESFQPLLRWTLAATREQGSLADSLRNLAPMYRKRGAFQAEKLHLFLPTVLMFLLGGLATLFYALTLFVPLSSMLRNLSLP
jgi:general secretion pathway protein F